MDLPRSTVAAGPAGAGREPTVACIRWPADEAERRRLADLARPRLLLVARGASLPDVDDDLEDWVAEDCPADDLLRRVANLEDRLHHRG